jgi:hypothetical protein
MTCNLILSRFYPDYETRLESAMKEVSENGLCLKDKDISWRSNEAVVLAAIRQNVLALRYVPFFKNNREFAIQALKINGLARVWLSDDLLFDPVIKKLSNENLPREFRTKGSGDRIFVASLYDNVVSPLIAAKEHFFSEITTITFETNETSVFIRDSSLTLLSGVQLIPYSLEGDYYDRLLALLPPTASHFFLNHSNNTPIKQGICGSGFMEKNVDQAMVTAYEHGLSFKRARTCIEGGNAFIFIAEGEKRAIIGEISFCLSYLSLEQQGIFNTIEAYEIVPSMQAYRIARNLAYLKQLEKSLEKTSDIDTDDEEDEDDFLSEDEKIYFKRLATPLSENDLTVYALAAQKIELRLQMTKQIISEELEIPFENLLFVPQTRFHIDLEMFITPYGEVVVNDSKKVIHFVNKILKKARNLEKGEQEILLEYKSMADLYIRLHNEVQERRNDLFKKHAIKYQVMPLIFESPCAMSSLNYCNGIFLNQAKKKVTILNTGEEIPYRKKKRNKFTFFTTGPSVKIEEIVHTKFISFFNKKFPDYNLQFIPMMSRLITLSEGGLHCATFENPTVFS